MTQEAQRIAIAEACGWKVHPKDKWVMIPPNSPHSVQPLYTLPDYLNDLNAMHEAEKSLNTKELWESYKNYMLIFMTEPVCATAAQRAEAFLRTIGKWTTNQNSAVKPKEAAPSQCRPPIPNPERTNLKII